MSQSLAPRGASGGTAASASDTVARHPRGVLGLSYFLSHWRGELAPAISWGVNGLAVGLIAISLAAAVGPSLDYVADAPMVVASLTALWALVGFLAVWQVVGIWRCLQRRGPANPVHAANARLALLVGVLISLGVFIRSGLPQIVEASQFAMGKDPIGEYSLRPIYGGAAIEVSGPIVFGLTDTLEKLLVQYPQATMLHLDSTGGRVVEARRLRDLIRARGLATFTSTNCASACVVAFAAGMERVVGRGGVIGFHRYRSQGMDENEVQASMAIDRREFAMLGVPDWFLEKAFTTPNDEMWRPSIAELKTANLVTSVTSAADIGWSLTSDRTGIESQLLKMPLYGALREYEPQVYQQFVDAIEGSAKRGVSLEESAVRSRPLLARLAGKYLASASNEAIVQATAVAAQTMRALQAHSAEQCSRYIQPGPRAADLSLVPNDLRERDLAATAALIMSGATADRHPIGHQAQDDLQAIFDRLVEQFGDVASVLSRLGAADLDPHRACGVVAALYENAIRLPAPRNAELLRYLLAGN